VRRAAFAIGITFVVACGGGRGPVTPSAAGDAREKSACEGDAVAKESEPRASRAPLAGDLLGLPIVKVDFAGHRRQTTEGLRALVGVRVGTPLERANVAAAIRALWASGAFEDVEVFVEPATGGVALTFMVRERPRVARVFAPGAPDEVRSEMARSLGLEPGSTLDPADLFDRRRALAVGLSARGATFDLRTQTLKDNEVDVCLLVGEGKAPSPEDRVRDWEHRSR
jgi:hypothetical protein